MKSLNVLLTISLAALAAGVVQAQPPGTETTSSVVNFADLNLHSPAGVAQLHARIRAAAIEVCGSAERHNLRAVSYVRACTAQAVARAIASVDTLAPSSLAARGLVVRQRFVVLTPRAAFTWKPRVNGSSDFQ